MILLRTIMILIFLFFSRAGFAQSIPETEALINRFAQAVVDKDEALIRRYWSEISQKPEVLNYMKQHHPSKYKSYEYYVLNFKLKGIRKAYFGREGDGDEQTLTPIRRTNRKSLRDQAIRQDNSNRIPNQETVSHYPNQTRPANNDLLRNTDNSDRPSNQEIIRRRLDRK